MRSKKEVPYLSVEKKYTYYEKSVQDADCHIDFMKHAYSDLNQKEPRTFREDFCGTFLVSSKWVKRNPNHTSMSIDLDPEPLEYGKKHHYKKLNASQKKRLQVIEGNVLHPYKKKVDLIGAFNFSFYIFKTEKTLQEYFRAAKKGLAQGGCFALEMVGGAGFVESTKESKSVKISSKEKIRYYWHQKSYDPMSGEGHYAIHFKDQKKNLYKDAFTYDWRVWTIPEVKYHLKKAGFKDVHVYWEREDEDGNDTGEYIRSTQGTNDHVWICYLIARNR